VGVAHPIAERPEVLVEVDQDPLDRLTGARVIAAIPQRHPTPLAVELAADLSPGAAALQTPFVGELVAPPLGPLSSGEG